VDQAVELPPISLPELADGLYRLRTSYFDGATLVVTDSNPFFIVSGDFRIVGLTSYPASSYPEADGLLRLSLDVPPASDPFLVWKINDTIVESGYLSETGATIAVLAPEAQGVFPVRVELYPLMPEGIDFGSIPAPTVYTAELYVSDSPAPGRTDLVPRESYFALYHLRGTLRDEGVRTDWFPSRDFAAEPFGAPELTVRAGVFGYALDGASGFRIGGSAWPMHDGAPSPVSISFRLLPDVLVGEATLMEIALGAAGLATMLVDESGRVGLRLASADDALWSASPMLAPGSPELITVSVVPGEESDQVSFFTDGVLVSSVETPEPILESIAGTRLVSGADRWALLEGTTTIGAETDGFIGVIDEFGVFFRDAENRPATNTALFRDRMRAEYGERLVYASAFEDQPIVFGPGDATVVAELEFSDEELVVRTEAEITATGALRFFDIAGSRLFAEVPLVPQDSEQAVEVILSYADGALAVARGEQVLAEARMDEFSGVRLELVVVDGESSEGVVRLRSVVAYRDQLRIPTSLFEVSDE
ncbi:MAG TPA: hypothetical protein VKA06_02690, partial [Spirochaetia bacterium]|nr:hypothetical protein [Spirochaetia bacterium]